MHPSTLQQSLRLLQRLGGLVAAVGASALLVPPLRAASPLTSAVVVEILDGNDLFIDERRARVRSQAYNPNRISTRNSRGQLTFNSRAAGRINRFSQVRLGTSCFLLSQGQILVSGNQSGCVRSARMSVRGTNYVITQAAEGGPELTVLEGSVDVEPLAPDGTPAPAPAVPVAAGWTARLDANGGVKSLQPLSLAALRALLEGPLFQGFTSPLPAGPALERHLQRAYPGLAIRLAAPSAAAHPLVATINALRLRNGREPLQPLPPASSAANRAYIQPVLRQILASGTCDHDQGAWARFQQEALSRFGAQPTSEVIACPRPLSQWQPQAIVDYWLTSQHHHDILLNRPRTTAIDCDELRSDNRAVAICTLWTPGQPPDHSRALTPR
jgi:hypothetical protein